MAWRYEVLLKELAPDQAGADLPLGLAIKKVFVDDATGEELVSTTTTAQDAKENGGDALVEEYIALARETISLQVARLLNYEDGSREKRPGSDATILGANLREIVETINYLLEE